MELKEKVECLWDKYSKYKETAEQHEFFHLIILDSKLIPAYDDLQINYSEEHAEIFVRMMEKVLESLGVKYDYN